LGKRLCVLLQVFLLSGLMGGRVNAQTTPPAKQQQVVYIYLNARLLDQVNIEMTEDRLRRLLPEIEKFRKAHPEAHVSAVLFFSGASSDALAQRNGKTHIVDMVKAAIQHGSVEAGYDGSSEPTYDTRPMLDFATAKSVGDRWEVRAKAAEEILTEARNPVTGAPLPGKTGGLARMQEVFGAATCITGVAPRVSVAPAVKTGPGSIPPKVPTPQTPLPMIVPELGGDSETLSVLRRLNTTAVMYGLAEDNPASLPGYGGALQGFGAAVSPIPTTAPEIYWQDNVLRTSEESNPSEAAEERDHGYDGLDGLKDDFKNLNRAKIHVVHVELADDRYYLKHEFAKESEYPLQYAYAHVDKPKLPAEQLLGTKEVDAWYAKEEAALQWLTGEWLPANPGSRFVSNADLKSMTEPSTGFSISVAALQADLKDQLEQWTKSTYPPTYFHGGGHYLSLADLFQVLTDALGTLDRTGKLPESVTVAPVYGPVYTVTGHGPNVGEVSVASITHFCAGLMDTLHDTKGGSPIPNNTIPNEVKVDNVGMNAAQFLLLMLKALEAPPGDQKIGVKMNYMFPGQAQLMPKTRIMGEMGAMWTVKPAPLSNAAVAAK
jgi:hypothetical protein